MGTETIYCQQCKKNYNVRKEDIQLMKRNDSSFDGEEYKKGCFFKDLTAVKRLINR